MGEPWKQLERDAAEALGGKRHVRADRGEVAADVDLPADSPFGAVECKHRKRLPALLLAGLAQAARYCRDGRPPLLVVKERGQHGALAVLALGDLLKLLGGIENAKTPADVEQ